MPTSWFVWFAVSLRTAGTELMKLLKHQDFTNWAFIYEWTHPLTEYLSVNSPLLSCTLLLFLLFPPVLSVLCGQRPTEPVRKFQPPSVASRMNGREPEACTNDKVKRRARCGTGVNGGERGSVFVKWSFHIPAPTLHYINLNGNKKTFNNLRKAFRSDSDRRRYFRTSGHDALRAVRLDWRATVLKEWGGGVS